MENVVKNLIDFYIKNLKGHWKKVKYIQLKFKKYQHYGVKLQYQWNLQAYWIANRFQEALVKYGVNEKDLFQTNDLSEKRDLSTVTNTIFAFGRVVRFRMDFDTL